MNDTPRADTNGVVATIHRDGYWTNKMPEQDPFPYLSQHGPIEVCLASELAAALEENAKLAARVRELERDAERVRLGLALSLDPLVINSDNIGGIRRSLFLPVDCLWNAMVRELTAERENQPPRHRDDVQQEIDAARGSKP